MERIISLLVIAMLAGSLAFAGSVQDAVPQPEAEKAPAETAEDAVPEADLPQDAGEAVGLANPWTEMTEEDLKQTAGVPFEMPEGAENAVYRWLESDGLAEMQFTMDGDEYCARAQSAELKESELMNISGMYFQWDHEEDVEINGCPGTLGLAQTGSEDWVELCLWYDANAKQMYSLSVYTTDPDGLDLTAVAQMVHNSDA
jgi:hypothetical protein